ncbi:MAG: cysteine-rich CWC family protein [Pyrinomonadaceae bacterium]
MTTLLKRFAAVISPRWRDPATCSACGGEFTCGATLAGCWCGEIKLTDATRAELRSRYSGCLCRKCLESLVAQTSVCVGDSQPQSKP